MLFLVENSGPGLCTVVFMVITFPFLWIKFAEHGTSVTKSKCEKRARSIWYCFFRDFNMMSYLFFGGNVETRLVTKK